MTLSTKILIICGLQLITFGVKSQDKDSIQIHLRLETRNFYKTNSPLDFLEILKTDFKTKNKPNVFSLDNKWDSGMSNFSIDNLENVDCILHGRKTGEGFIPYWTEVANNPNDSEHKLGKRFAEIPNAIFSKTLKESMWDNTTIIKGEISEEINALKNKKGKDIIVYGGESFVSTLLQHDLIDEVYLLVNPAAIGNGQQTFNPLRNDSALKLVECKPFACGIVLLCYERKK